MRDAGAVPYTYTADLGQYDEDDLVGVPGRAKVYGAEEARLVDCRSALVNEGIAAMTCGAFHIRSGAQTYFNTTPLGRAVTGTLLVRAMHEDGVSIWGDGSTFKGNDIERFYRYGLLANPGLRIYKPWLDERFVTELGGRKEMSEWLVAHDLPYRDPTEKAYSTDANIWGATHEAKSLEQLDTSMEIVEPIMGVRFWDPPVEIETEDVTLTFEGGQPVAINGRVRHRRRPGDRREHHRRAPRPGHVRPDREPHHRGQEPGRVRGARAWPCWCSATSGCSSAIHNEDTLDAYFTQGRKLGRFLYEGRWFDPQALMIREGLQRWIASPVTGHRHPAAASRQRLHRARHDRPRPVYQPDRLSMERNANAAFGPTDRIGQLTMRNLDIADTRTRLQGYAGRGQLVAEGPPALRHHPAPRPRRRHREPHRVREQLRARERQRRRPRDPRPRGDGVRHRLSVQEAACCSSSACAAFTAASVPVP